MDTRAVQLASICLYITLFREEVKRTTRMVGATRSTPEQLSLPLRNHPGFYMRLGVKNS